MKNWRQHWTLIALLFALGLLIAAVDWITLGPRPGGWISLDFRGMLAIPYAVGFVLYLLLTTAVMGLSRAPRVGAIHIYTAAALIASLVLALLAMILSE